jgi:hypothetical protein
MCEVRSREKRARTTKKKYNGQQQKEMDCHEPHPAPNEKAQPIQWTERPTGALVAVNSLWPKCSSSQQLCNQFAGVNFIDTISKLRGLQIQVLQEAPQKSHILYFHIFKD